MLQSHNEDSESIKFRCYEIINGFHHREALREDDIRHWISHVVGAHGEAATWHAARASGFGGSDIGVIARNFSGHRADHMNSAHDIVQSKLLKSVPDEDTGDLRRGHENEPAHALKYYKKYAAIRDQSAYETLSKSQGLRMWMRYSPDDVVLLPSSKPNPSLGGAFYRRLLIDYKAPRNIEPDEQIAFQYSCQLHQGAMICAKAGIHLDGLQLSQYDWAHWELKDDYVDYDPEISRLILRAGDHYFDFVMRGELPPYIVTPKFEREAEFVEAFGQKAQRLAHISAVAAAFESAKEVLSQELKAYFKDVRLAGKKMQLGDLAVTAVSLVDHESINSLLRKDEIALLRKKNAAPDYDTKAMAEKLTQLGGNPESFRIDKIDADMVYPALIAKGFDPEQFTEEQIRFKAADYLKEAARQLVAMTFPADSVAENVITVDQDLVESSTQQDVREGQSTERHAQRTAMA